MRRGVAEACVRDGVVADTTSLLRRLNNRLIILNIQYSMFL